MPVLGGIEAAQQLREAGSRARFVFLTIHNEGEVVDACVAQGAFGYAVGGLPGERLLNRLGIKSSDTVLRRVKGRRRGAIQPAVRAER